MNVIKRHGGIQPFDKEKLKASILSASDEIEQPLNKADLDYVVGTIEETLKV